VVGFLFQERQRPLENRLLTPVFHALDRTFKRLCDATIGPAWSFRTLIAFQKGPGSENLPSRGFGRMNDPIQHLTLLRQQLKHIFLTWHKATLLCLMPIIRTHPVLAQIHA
jgi:hypothetical protein